MTMPFAPNVAMPPSVVIWRTKLSTRLVTSTPHPRSRMPCQTTPVARR
jgi:hypothetical protein